MLTGCGDGNFTISDRSQIEGDTSNNNYFIPEPHEGIPMPTDGIMSPIMTTGNPDCDSSEVMGLDGDGDFLWKPASDFDGKLVVLFPAEYQTKFKEVYVTRLDGTVEFLYFTGYANANRQHWRGLLSGDNYTGNITASSMVGQCVWNVPNPSERQD